MSIIADVDIVNMSLAEIGESPINSLDQNSSVARKVKAIYYLKRDELLRMHPWGFAKARVFLAKSVEKPVWGYSKYYLIPEDCLKILTIDVGEHPFHKEGRYIATDSDQAGLLYISRVEDSNLFDASFKTLFSKYLSANLAWPIKGSRTLRSDLMNEFNRELSLARGYSATEGTPHSILEFDGDGIIAGSAGRGRISTY